MMEEEERALRFSPLQSLQSTTGGKTSPHAAQYVDGYRHAARFLPAPSPLEMSPTAVYTITAPNTTPAAKISAVPLVKVDVITI
jgi:hypothetical protein